MLPGRRGGGALSGRGWHRECVGRRPDGHVPGSERRDQRPGRRSQRKHGPVRRPGRTRGHRVELLAFRRRRRMSRPLRTCARGRAGGRRQRQRSGRWVRERQGVEQSDRDHGDAGNDTLTATNCDSDVVSQLHGDQGNDRLTGGEDADELFGGPGNDRLDGGCSSDDLDGGFGTDLIRGELSQGLCEALNGGSAGMDTVLYTNRTAPVRLNLGNPSFAQGEAGEFEDIDGVEEATTGAGDDEIFGSEGRNTIKSGAGNDSVNGSDGLDDIDGARRRPPVRRRGDRSGSPWKASGWPETGSDTSVRRATRRTSSSATPSSRRARAWTRSSSMACVPRA